MVGLMTDNNALTPFSINVHQSDIDDLRDRLARARWPHPVPGRDDRTDFSRGIPTPYLQGLVEYWRDGFDWRAQEARLNEIEQVTTIINDQTFHIVHAQSSNPEATPLLLHHGWPGSFVEYQRLIPLLTNEFHVVIPSPPGFGFSTPLASTGWELPQTADAFAEIMTRLGYQRFAAHGTDVGTGIMARLASVYPERVIGTHYGAERRLLGLVGVLFPAPVDLVREESSQLAVMQAAAASEHGYLEMHNHKPDTIGAALTDSPVALLAWIVEKFKTRDDSCGTPDESVDRDQLLANVTLYWFTRSGESSAQFYYEAQHSGVEPAMFAPVPTGWAVFDTHPLMRRVMNPAGAIAHWREYAEGGHFPAMEQPVLLADDIYTFFRSFP